MNEMDKHIFELLRDNERKWQQIESEKAAKNAVQTVVKSAALGGIVAGPVGAVVGAIVGKTQIDSLSSESTEMHHATSKDLNQFNETGKNSLNQGGYAKVSEGILYYQYSIDDEIPMDLDEEIRIRMKTNIKAKNAEGKFSNHYMRIRDLNAIIGVLEHYDELTDEEIVQYLSEQSLNINSVRVGALLRELIRDGKVQKNEIQRKPYYSLCY
ncbi:MAG: hypothetical protein IKV26_06835 [Paludibacteraceae bacterium]|nr:hypothetical protein [Paludibacteraceae bacterium]